MGHRLLASFANARRDARGSGMGRKVRVGGRHGDNSFARKISQTENARSKWGRDQRTLPRIKATSPVKIAHLLFISAKWSKLNSAGKRNMLASQPDAAPVRRSRAVSRDDPSATSPCAGVVSFNRDRIVREVQSERTKPHIFKN
jgi:hypothetical protein